MFLILTTLGIPLLIWALLKIREHLPTRRDHHIKNPRHCRSLIAACELPGFQPNQLSPYESRSMPNRRHVRAFGIENAFTTSDAMCAQEFADESRKLINLTQDEWQKLAVTAKRAARIWKSRLDTSYPDIKLVSLAQALSLHAVLWAFFSSRRGNTGEEIPFDKLVRLSNEINQAWIASKDENTLVEFIDNASLQGALIAVLPKHNIFNPRENPLRLILPGFETLWRIVLRTFIEIGYKTGKKHPRWGKAMIAFARKPSASQFADTTSGNGVSAKFLVNEALRVYPPTKRVYRAWKEDPAKEPIEIAADIEVCHLNEEIWGPTATQFDPSRWEQLTDAQEEAFLPFGSKPFQCPAKPVFGPNIIGILVGTMLDAFRDYWPFYEKAGEKVQYYWPLALKDGELIEFGEERLDSSRDAYTGMRLFNITLLPYNFLYYADEPRRFS